VHYVTIRITRINKGYDQGVHDWNTFYNVQNHHFICPYNDTSAYCFGYDAALQFETNDQQMKKQIHEILDGVAN
jgi:hypothetical protein